MTFRSATSTKTYRPMEVIEAQKPDGVLVRVDAPQTLLDLIRRMPGGEAIDETGVVTNETSLELVLIVAVACALFAANFQAGYAKGQEAAPAEGEGESEEDTEDSGDGDEEGAE